MDGFLRGLSCLGGSRVLSGLCLDHRASEGLMDGLSSWSLAFQNLLSPL